MIHKHDIYLHIYIIHIYYIYIYMYYILYILVMNTNQGLYIGIWISFTKKSCFETTNAIQLVTNLLSQ